MKFNAFNKFISFDPRIIRHNECGLFERMFDCLDQAAKASCRSSKLEVLESLDAYAEECTRFSNLGFYNFRFIFRYGLIICLLVFTAFCAHHLTEPAKQLAFLIGTRLKDYSIRFGCGLKSAGRKLADYLSNLRILKIFKKYE